MTYIVIYVNGEQVKVPANELRLYDPFPEDKKEKEKSPTV